MSSEPVSLATGLILNNIYRLERLLGKGGMGEVWLATHLLLNEPRAIKIMLPSYTEDALLQARFILGEARNALRLQHPNIVRVYDLGMDYNFPYIVMEYVAGDNLKQWLKLNGKLSLEQTDRLLTQIGEALAHAHQHSLIHRDVKPANILVTAEGDFKLADFGIVKDSQSEFDLTNPGLAIGTPAYASPEQAVGQADARSDIYSLGVVVYEALTAQQPFSSQPAIMAAMTPTSLEPPIPPELNRVIAKALSRNLTERYNSVLEFVHSFTQALHNQQFKAELPTLQLATPVNSSNTPSSAKKTWPNLPLQSNALLGRSQEISEIRELLLQTSYRLITLVGIGGTGKTRLAIAVGETFLTEFEEIYFLGLETVTERNTFINTLAATFSLGDQPDKPLLEVVKIYLAHKKILLVLDNFEQLIVEGATLLPELLKAANSLTLLVTSRIPLQLSMEREYNVTPLPLPDKVAPQATPESLIEYPAIALFVARAQTVRPEFELTQENAFSCEEICRKLDGLPLAIELAAARTRAFSPQKILERLSLKLLSGGSRDLPSRQQTLRGTIEWSYSLLTADEQILFRRLSIFGGGFTLEAAEAVCNFDEVLELEPFEGIESLVLKNLLKQKAAENNQLPFGMLETIREYGLEKLKEHNELENLYIRYAAYYAELCRELEPQLRGADAGNVLRRLDAEYSNLREILAHSLSEKSPATQSGQVIAAALWWYWRNRGLLSEGRNYLERALTTLTDNDLRQKATLLNALADFCSRSGEPGTAINHAKESLRLFREASDKTGTGKALLTLGWIVASQGDYEVGVGYLEEGLALFRELGNKPGIGNTLLNLGWVATNQSDFAKATSYLEESLRLFRELNDKWGIGNTLNVLGVVALDAENFATSKSYLEESLFLFREIGYSFGVANLLNNLGFAALNEKDYAVATEYLTESLARFREMDAKQSISNALENLAATALEQEDFAKAIEYMSESVVLWQQLNDKRGLLYSIADFMGLQGKYLLKAENKLDVSAFSYLAHLAGTIEQLTQAGKLKLVEQPWRAYYEAGRIMAQNGLTAEQYQTAFGQGQQFTMAEIVQYALTIRATIFLPTSLGNGLQSNGLAWQS